MKQREMMPIEDDQAEMWQLSADKRSVRMKLPVISVDGLSKPVRVKIDFDAGTIEQIIERLTVLRAKMLPAQSAPRLLN